MHTGSQSGIMVRMSAEIGFDVWGCRGSHSSAPGRSRIGCHTSCYSLHCGQDLFVFDAGRGIALLADATTNHPRLRQTKRIHLFVSHAHMDHWEGLKDAGWFWTPKNGLSVAIYGTREAIDTIQRGLAPPAFVPLDVLAQNSVAKLTWNEVHAGEAATIAGQSVLPIKLNHYSGLVDSRRDLDTVGYRVSIANGPSVAYLCDHEPTAATQAAEDVAMNGAQLAVLDCQFADRKDHAFGHGSQEHAAACAKRHPGCLVLCAHHGPRSDEHIEEGLRRHGAGLTNIELAVEGRGLLWNATNRTFSFAT